MTRRPKRIVTCYSAMVLPKSALQPLEQIPSAILSRFLTNHLFWLRNEDITRWPFHLNTESFWEGQSRGMTTSSIKISFPGSAQLLLACSLLQKKKQQQKKDTPVSGTGTGRITRTRTRQHGKPIKLKIHRVKPGARFSKAPETFRARKAIGKSQTLRF